jgi:hypothetical protein
MYVYIDFLLSSPDCCEKQGAKLKEAPKKAKDFVAKKKANAEFDPNAMLSDLVIKCIPSTSAAKSKKE